MVSYDHFRAPDEIAKSLLGARFSIQGIYEGPFHAHRKAQLFFATEGVITVDSVDALWVTPPYRAVWVPSEAAHTVRGTGIRDIYCLYVEPEVAAAMPQQCCVISVSPLLREMILRVVLDDEEGMPASRRSETLASALLAELEMAPREAILLPMPEERRTRKVAEAMLKDPADRRSLAEWGHVVGASARTLARHFERDTGVSFGRWRQQLDVALAIQKLCSGEPVQQVASALGYETASSFIAMFRRAMGETPARYLKTISRRPDGERMADED